jgi:hypothetical protein
VIHLEWNPEETMKKLLLLAVMVLAAVNLTGCVIFHSTTDIKADGSGVAELTMSMSPSVQEAIKELQAMDSPQAQEMDFPMMSDLNKADLEKAAKGHGVKVKKFEKTSADGREGMTIVLAFEDLKGLSFVMGRVMGEGGNSEGMGIFDAGEGNYVLRSAQYDFPAEPDAEEKADVETSTAPATDMDPAQMQKQMEIMGKLMGAMAELDVSFKITVPGEIVSTNAPETDGRTSIWAINSGNMMSMDQNMEPEIVFAGKGLKIKPLKE